MLGGKVKKMRHIFRKGNREVFEHTQVQIKKFEDRVEHLERQL